MFYQLDFIQVRIDSMCFYQLDDTSSRSLPDKVDKIELIKQIELIFGTPTHGTLYVG